MTKPTQPSRLRRLWRFISEEVWDVDLAGLSRMRRLGVQAVRVAQLVLRGFRDDECPLHAAALTFSTLMALVPLLALSLAVARGFGDSDTAQTKIRGLVSEWTRTFSNAPPSVVALATPGPSTNAAPAEIETPSAFASEVDRLVTVAFEKVENVNFTALTGVGLLVLLVMAIQVMGQIEGSFNRIWGVTVGRSFWRRFTDYLSVLFILPFLIIAASSLPIVEFADRFLQSSLADRADAVFGSGFLKNLTVLSLTTACFSFPIMFMPNTRVRLIPGLTGGLVTALLFIGWLWLCAALQGGVARAGRIYGSFAVVPILLAWINISWQIVFFGAEVAFAVQNNATYRMEQGAARASMASRVTLAMSVLREAALAADGTRDRFRVSVFAQERRVPVRFLNEVVDELTRAGYLGELAGSHGSFVLMRAPEAIALRDVLSALVQAGVGPGALGLQAPDPSIERLVGPFVSGAGIPNAAGTLRDLIGGAPASAAAPREAG